LYVIIDIYSRHVVGWMVADRESSALAERLLADLGVTKTHSRPHVSNDNPYSEAQFKTLKYRPDFPRQFGSLEDARGFCQQFFAWYNNAHRHSGIGFHTPADIYYGRASWRRAHRTRVLTAAYVAHPERFVRKPPEPPGCPTRPGSTAPPRRSPNYRLSLRHLSQPA
jgi:putative transposase